MLPEERATMMNILVVTACPSDLNELNLSLADESRNLILVDGHAAIESLQSNRNVDCVLVRITEANESEFRLISTMKERWPAKPIVAYGDNWQISGVVQAIKHGADEVCEFTRNRSELSNTVARMLSSEVNRQLQFGDIIPKDILQKLNSEEARILHLLVQGRTTKQVGATLNVSIRTIHYRKKELLRKLGVQNRSEAIEMIRIAAGGLFAGFGSGSNMF